MADVYLRFKDGTVIADVPMVCMKCGAPATVRKSKVFIRIPTSKKPVAHILAHFLPGVGIILVAFLFKRYYVETPFCDQHESYWWKYPFRMWLLVLGMIWIDVVTVIGVADAFQGANAGAAMARPISGIVCFTLALVELAIILVILMKNRRIRPTQITKRHICLTGVSAEFAEAVEDLQAAQQDMETQAT
jgi:hypothetical protein